MATARVRPPGSPPRAWGRRNLKPAVCAANRFTPTCVGTTHSAQGCPSPLPVHPHVRGDDCGRTALARHHLGSPPRAWGRRMQSVAVGLVWRFTPTCVGTTVEPSPGVSAISVHPHVRGDDGAVHVVEAEVAGSPPRAWGRRHARIWSPRSHRFTPTCVGTTTCRWSALRHAPVHPHVRGDDVQNIYVIMHIVGSPPRAWGRLKSRQGDIARARFTPTCVGTTGDDPRRVSNSAVHPHVRGDDRVSARALASAYGSPPRAWGRPLVVDRSSH